MGMIGFGLGVMYAGIFCLLSTWVEYRDIVNRSTEVGRQAYEMAMEIVGWGVLFGSILLGVGVVVLIVGLIYRNRTKKER